MPALEPLSGIRVVAMPSTLWTVDWEENDAIVLLIAPDEAFAIGATGASVDDPEAIVESEGGFVGGWCTRADLLPHVEWNLDLPMPQLAQGKVAGVPVKLWLTPPDRVLVVTNAAYADELSRRLGWDQ